MKQKVLFQSVYAFSLLAFAVTSSLAQGVISTVGGTGIGGFSGDGGPALSAMFSSPAGVSTDAAGNIFVADKGNHRIRKIGTDGTTATVAGNGSGSYTGMGGLATLASMEYPDAIFVDNHSNLLVTDFFADCSYTVSASTGRIVNSCGHNSQGYGGDGGDAPLGTMELPHGIWKDNLGNTFIADFGNNRLRKINAVTGFVSTIAGTGTPGYSPDGTLASLCHFAGIYGVCVDNNGNIFVSDHGNHVVRMIDGSGRVHTVAGSGIAGYTGDGGPAIAASLNAPGGLYVNTSGFLFICDETSNVVRVVNLNTGIIKTFAGNGAAGFAGDGGLAVTAKLNMPSAITEIAGTFYIADMGNNRIRKVVDASYKSSSFNSVGSVGVTNFNIFPNPSNGNFILQTDEIPDNAVAEVYNIIGVKVYSQVINKMETAISLNLPSGLYNIALRSGDNAVTHKITIQK